MFAHIVYVKTASYYRVSTLEEIWVHVWDNFSIIIPRVFDIVLLVMWFFWDYMTMTNTISETIQYFYPKSSKILDDSFFVGTCTFFIICIPLIAIQNVRTLSYVYLFDIICFAAMILSTCTLPDTEVSPKPFEPQHFQGISLYSFSTLFTIHPMAYPGIRQLSRTTEKQLTFLFVLAVIFSCIFDILTSEVLLRKFDSNKINNDQYVFSTEIHHPVIYFASIYSNAITLMTSLNPLRYCIINILYPSDDIPYVLWVWAGLLISSAGTYLTRIGERLLSDAAYFIEAVFVLSLNFGFPAILYLKTFGFSSKPVAIGAIGLICFEIFVLVYLVL